MTRPISRSSRRVTAYHEAAHAVADHRFGFTTIGVTIVKSGHVLGHADSLDGADPLSGAAERETFAVCLLAGYAAAVRLNPRGRWAERGGACSDFEKAREIADVPNALRRAHRFVRREWAAIELVARELLVRDRLGCEEVETLVEIADGAATPADLARWRLFSARDPGRSSLYRASVNADGSWEIVQQACRA